MHDILALNRVLPASKALLTGVSREAITLQKSKKKSNQLFSFEWRRILKTSELVCLPSEGIGGVCCKPPQGVWVRAAVEKKLNFDVSFVNEYFSLFFPLLIMLFDSIS